MSNGGSGQHPPAPASREIHPWCETRGHGAHSFAPGDRGFGSRSLHRRVYCEPDFLGSRSIKHAFTHKPPSSTTILSLSRTGASSPRPSKQASLAPSPCAWTGYKQASLSVKLGPPEPTNPMVVVRPQFRPPGVDDAARVATLRAMRSTPSTAGGVERRTLSLRMSPLSCRRTGPKYPTPTPAEHLSDWSSA